MLPHIDEDLVGIIRIHDHFTYPGFGVDVEDFFPGFASICCFVHSPVFLFSPRRTDCTDKNSVGIIRVNDDAVNGTGFFQSHQLPGFSCIEGSVHAITHIEGVSWISFSGSYPDDIWVFLIDGNSADRVHAFLIKNRLPRDAA